MNPKQMLLGAIGGMASVIGALFIWAQTQFSAATARAEKCEASYVQVLKHLAKLEKMQTDNER